MICASGLRPVRSSTSHWPRLGLDALNKQRLRRQLSVVVDRGRIQSFETYCASSKNCTMTTPTPTTATEEARPTANTIQRRRIIYMRPFAGEIQPGDLQLVTDELCIDLAENEILCEALHIGIDAGLKQQVLHYPDGITMIGGQVARIVRSRNARFDVGALVYGKFGWQTHTVCNPDEGRPEGGAPPLTPYVLTGDMLLGGAEPQLALGCLGVTGNAALLGLNDLLRPQRGQTVLVTAAAGGVGHLVGQLARRLFGCRVVGVCGTPEKCEWLRAHLQFDAAVCHRSATFVADLAAATPQGVDRLWDSVGGRVYGECVQRMNERGRIVVNGALAGANEVDATRVPENTHDVHRYFVAQQLTMQGFCVWDQTPSQWFKNIRQLATLLKDGKIVNCETVLEGFERCPEALGALLRGDYCGRVVIKV